MPLLLSVDFFRDNSSTSGVIGQWVTSSTCVMTSFMLSVEKNINLDNLTIGHLEKLLWSMGSNMIKCTWSMLMPTMKITVMTSLMILFSLQINWLSCVHIARLSFPNRLSILPNSTCVLCFCFVFPTLYSRLTVSWAVVCINFHPGQLMVHRSASRQMSAAIFQDTLKS